MQKNSLVIVLAAAAVVLLTVGLIAAPNLPNPGPSEEATRVDAPFTAVETDKDGTKVRAPFVDIEVPKDKKDPAG